MNRFGWRGRRQLPSEFQTISRRDGRVLTPGTILKLDQYDPISIPLSSIARRALVDAVNKEHRNNNNNGGNNTGNGITSPSASPQVSRTASGRSEEGYVSNGTGEKMFDGEDSDDSGVVDVSTSEQDIIKQARSFEDLNLVIEDEKSSIDDLVSPRASRRRQRAGTVLLDVGTHHHLNFDEESVSPYSAGYNEDVFQQQQQQQQQNVESAGENTIGETEGDTGAADADFGFPVMQAYHPEVRFSGVVNFRQSEPLLDDPQTSLKINMPQELYACSQPTTFGTRAILNFITESEDDAVLWINLREEPIIYINKRPFVVRDASHPFRNVQYYSGITPEMVEKIEERLKEDLIEEAKKYANNLLVHDELKVIQDSSAVPVIASCWEAITNGSVQTTREVFEELAQSGYRLHYERIPTTPEVAPDPSNYIKLVECLRTYGTRVSKVVFNDQLGKRRCTHASCVATLFNLFRYNSLDDVIELVEYIKRQQQHSPLKESGELMSMDINAQLRRGEYKVILDLLRVMDLGEMSKHLVDAIIDANSHVISLRDSVFLYRTLMSKSRTAEDKELASKEAFKHLGRYYSLICFTQYLASSSSSGDMPSFEQWWKKRPELASILGNYTDADQISKALSGHVEHSRVSDAIAVSKRQGRVLGPSTILKLDHFFSNMPHFAAISKVQRVEGAPNLRKVNLGMGVELWASGTPTARGASTVLHRLRARHTVVQMVNLREEPTVYINGRSVVVRDIRTPFTNMNLQNIGSEHLEEMEDRIKQDILDEILREDGKILIHDETEDQGLITVWELATPDHVMTSKQLMQTLMDDYGYKLQYARIPITPLHYLSFNDFDDLLGITLRNASSDNEKKICYFTDHFGLGRVNTAMIIATLVNKLTIRGIVARDMSANRKANAEGVHPQILSSLLRLLEDGVSRLEDVNHAIERCKSNTEFLDVRYQILNNLRRAEKARSQEQIDNCMKRVAIHVKQYVLLIMFASYLVHNVKRDDQDTNVPFQVKCTFRNWVTESRSELLKLLHEIDHYEESGALKLVSQSNRDAIRPTDPTWNDGMRVVLNRNYRVLQKKCILKADHFPGCQRKHLTPRIEGAPNFRRVSPDQDIFGVAMATERGVENVMQYLNAKKKDLLWTNMREEPVVYINGLPFVLRELDKPVVNIEHTGITYKRVLDMENRLKQDVLDECNRNHGHVLVHDEDPTTLIMFCEWRRVETVKTPLEVYTEFVQRGYRVKYVRIPVTDEQAPSAEDFDDLVHQLLGCNPDRTSFVMNCQMGRGRTTTACVIAYLVNIWKNRLASGKLGEGRETSAMRSALQEAEAEAEVETEKIEEQQDGAQDVMLRNGFYPEIVALGRLLEDWVDNKRMVDTIIDQCSHMQNLRVAILDFKQKSEIDPISSDAKAFKQSYVFYLERYFLLLVFNEYLRVVFESLASARDDIAVQNDKIIKRQLLFRDWIVTRPEIVSLQQTILAKLQSQ